MAALDKARCKGPRVTEGTGDLDIVTDDSVEFRCDLVTGQHRGGNRHAEEYVSVGGVAGSVRTRQSDGCLDR